MDEWVIIKIEYRRCKIADSENAQFALSSLQHHKIFILQDED